MKTPLAVLSILALLATATTAAPADHIGRLLPQLQLYGGTVHTNATITAADENGITITTAQGETTISRYLLSPAARVALDYPEDPDKIPRQGHFKVTQILDGGVIVRRYTPAPKAGSVQALTNEILGYRATRTDAEVGDQPIFLDGTLDDSIADGDIIAADYIDTGSTRELKETTTNTKRRLRHLLLLTSRRYIN